MSDPDDMSEDEIREWRGRRRPRHWFTKVIALPLAIMLGGLGLAMRGDLISHRVGWPIVLVLLPFFVGSVILSSRLEDR